MVYQEIIDNFHKLIYSRAEKGETTGNAKWLGVPTIKLPFDLWVYQEIIVENRPDFVIETGTFLGGSALFIATIMDAISHGQVITIDDNEFPIIPHKRIRRVRGDSINPEIASHVRNIVWENSITMVVLDSNHCKTHVLEELYLYAPLVSKGEYLIAEDTNVNGNPVVRNHGPGPMEAVEEFLKDHPEFEIDRSREKFLLSYFPKGFLKRK